MILDDMLGNDDPFTGIGVLYIEVIDRKVTRGSWDLKSSITMTS